MATADKLKNIRKAKKDLADKFYINEVTPLADFVDLISNTEDIEVGYIDSDKNFQPFASGENTSDAEPVEEFYDFAFAEDLVIPEPERVENQTYSPAKFQNILDAKNAIKTKFGLSDVLSEYAETIPLGDSVILGHVNTDKNFQDLVFYDKTGIPKNDSASAEFYEYIYTTITAPSSVTFFGYQGINFSKQLAASVSNGDAPTFTATDLPEGLSCSSDGLISGIPAELGEFTGTVIVKHPGASAKSIVIYFKFFDVATMPLTFIAEKAGSRVVLNATGNPTVSGLQYRTDMDAEFAAYTCGTEITLANVGDIVQFRNTEEILSHSGTNSVRFAVTGRVALEGNMQSMLNYIDSCKNSCYSYMFFNCTGLTSISEGLLPATTLAYSCYDHMFYGCTGLTTTPALPATTLAYSCYNSMFAGCTSLTAIPEGLLPATTLADFCYRDMFYGCEGLTTAPALPATTLAKYCYMHMFSYCKGLTTAPALPATTLTIACYSYMFLHCEGLTTAPALPATTLDTGCYSSIFSYCKSLTSISVHFTAWSDATTTNWLASVAANGTFRCPQALATTVERGADTIPKDWIIEYID